MEQSFKPFTVRLQSPSSQMLHDTQLPFCIFSATHLKLMVIELIIQLMVQWMRGKLGLCLLDLAACFGLVVCVS